MAEWYHWSWNVFPSRVAFLRIRAFSSVKITGFDNRRGGAGSASSEASWAAFASSSVASSAGEKLRCLLLRDWRLLTWFLAGEAEDARHINRDIFWPLDPAINAKGVAIDREAMFQFYRYRECRCKSALFQEFRLIAALLDHARNQEHRALDFLTGEFVRKR